MKLTVKQLALGGLFLALGLVLPFFTAQVPSIGSKLLPMHIPVLLCGFVCGGPVGLIVGAVTPLLRSMMFGMPPMFPTATAMAFELAAYGFLAGFFYRRLPKNLLWLYVDLLLAMAGGRIVWGAVSMALYAVLGNPFTWEVFLAGAVLNALPGITLQLVIIPPIVMALKRAKLVTNRA